MRPIRISVVNGLYHIVTRCDNKNFYFREEEDFVQYLQVLEKAREKYGFKIHAYCVTSNHVHLLISTPKEDNLSLAMQYINGQYAKNYNRRHKRSGHLWGERFFSTIIESESQLINTMLYIELNMTRNGVTNHPKEWKWSSYNYHTTGKGPIQTDHHDIYINMGTNDRERQQNYTKIMEESMIEKGLLLHQPQLTRGLIYGSKVFINEIIVKHTSHAYYKKYKVHHAYGDSYCLRKHKRIPES